MICDCDILDECAHQLIMPFEECESSLMFCEEDTGDILLRDLHYSVQLLEDACSKVEALLKVMNMADSVPN